MPLLLVLLVLLLELEDGLFVLVVGASLFVGTKLGSREGMPEGAVEAEGLAEGLERLLELLLLLVVVLELLARSLLPTLASLLLLARDGGPVPLLPLLELHSSSPRSTSEMDETDLLAETLFLFLLVVRPTERPMIRDRTARAAKPARPIFRILLLERVLVEYFDDEAPPAASRESSEVDEGALLMLDMIVMYDAFKFDDAPIV